MGWFCRLPILATIDASPFAINLIFPSSAVLPHRTNILSYEQSVPRRSAVMIRDGGASRHNGGTQLLKLPGTAPMDRTSRPGYLREPTIRSYGLREPLRILIMSTRFRLTISRRQLTTECLIATSFRKRNCTRHRRSYT